MEAKIIIPPLVQIPVYKDRPKGCGVAAAEHDPRSHCQKLGSSWFGVGKNEWAVSRNRLLGIEMKGVVMAEKLVMIPGCKKPDGCRMNIDSPDFVHKRP